jgi:hypothetical protein
MRLFRRSELLKSLLEDTEDELKVEDELYTNGYESDYTRINVLLAYKEFLEELMVEEDKVCIAVEGQTL